MVRVRKEAVSTKLEISFICISMLYQNFLFVNVGTILHHFNRSSWTEVSSPISLRPTLPLKIHSAQFHSNPQVPSHPHHNTAPKHSKSIVENNNKPIHTSLIHFQEWKQRNPRIWKRLNPVYELALRAVTYTQTHLPHSATQITPSVVDVGCDHGLLAIAFSISDTSPYRSIHAIDVSDAALQNAIQNYNILQTRLRDYQYDGPNYPIHFHLSINLTPLSEGQAHTVCIAGMGESTMLNQILLQRDLQSLDVRNLVLQPASSRPKYLLKLYHRLASSSWNVVEENIVFTQSRYYMTTRFQKSSTPHSNSTTTTFITSSLIQSTDWLPGYWLWKNSNTDTHMTFQNYLRYHVKWIHKLQERKKWIPPLEQAWLQFFSPFV